MATIGYLQADQPDAPPCRWRFVDGARSSGRIRAELGADGRTIVGAWDIDEGDGWRRDVGLTYRRV